MIYIVHPVALYGSCLMRQVRDEAGFFWDIGVHCVFSHFEFFDSLLDDLILPRDWLYHQRYSPAHMRGSWVGYPVQANLWRLPEKEVVGIISDLASRAASAGGAAEKPRDFKEWLERSFGKALTESFMAPYNAKVWAHPADQMNAIWVRRDESPRSSHAASRRMSRRMPRRWASASRRSNSAPCSRT